jgi:hypothetical protein
VLLKLGVREDQIEFASWPFKSDANSGMPEEALEVQDKCFLEAPIQLETSGLDLNKSGELSSGEW